MRKKIVSIATAALLLFCAVGGTIAWLKMRTDSIVNTFVAGDIDITLTETTGEIYKMVPGTDIAKDPKVTVKAGSEACWVFVKVDKSANFNVFMTCEMADEWTLVPGEANVYYREASASNANQDFAVLADNAVSVSGEVTKTQLNALTSDTQPTLTFTAYAVQKAGFDTVEAAWAEAGTLDN